jgi:hypothetical protein
MKKISLMFIIVALLMCAGWSASAADEVTVGAVTPLTGKLAVYGEGFQKAMLLALDEVNAAGGINGKTMKLSLKIIRPHPKDRFQPFRN